MEREKKMNNFERHSKTLLWFMALLLAFIVNGCGSGGGGDSGNGIQTISQNSVPGAPGAIPPGTVPPVTASTSTVPTGTVPTGTVPTGTTGTASGPSVSSSNPTNGATNVAVSTVGPGNVPMPRTISATFSEAMNPATIVSPALSFTVKETISGNSVAGSVSMNAANTISTFTPNDILASNTQFTAIITAAATNTAGTALINSYGWSFTTGAQSGQAPINLGTAASFVVLGGTSIANDSTASNPTRVNGQLGIYPGSATSVTGFTESTDAGTGIISTGGIQFGTVVSQAINDLRAALTDANARTSNQVTLVSNDLATFTVSGGTPGVYPPGLYSSVSPLALSSGNMTLDAKGDPDAVWVFKAGSSLAVGDTRQIFLLNGAKASNVFWRLGSNATIGDQVSFKGNILAASSIAIGTATANGTTVEGRVLSVSGVDLHFTTINAPAP
jgi:hypothetical protein